jgi:hypothetical protein
MTTKVRSAGDSSSAGERELEPLCTNKAGAQKLAAWTLGEAHPASLEIRLKGEKQIIAVGGNGEGFLPKIHSSRLLLELRSAPQYVTLGKAVLKQRSRVTFSAPGARSR